MKLLASLLMGSILILTSTASSHAHTEGATSVHEISAQGAPTIKLDVKRDPTGGYNVRVVTTDLLWKPESASMEYVFGQGHAHVYFDGVKIMRIYNEWFHLNLFQFAKKSGTQLLSVELVGNDHAPYTTEGAPIGSEELITVLESDLAPTTRARYGNYFAFIGGGLLVFGFATTILALRLRRNRAKPATQEGR
jgi:hypothetical protein